MHTPPFEDLVPRPIKYEKKKKTWIPIHKKRRRKRGKK